jgi:hypothetical protein
MLAPRPSTKRPPESLSMSIAAIAVSKGLRADAIAIPLASSRRCVDTAAAASGIHGGP